MPRLLALEWDQREARLVAAHRKGSTLVVQQALSVPLLGRTEGIAPTASEVAEKIASAMAKAGLSKGDILLAIGRANIELRLLNLPPAPPEETSQLVRFQALREFHSLAEDWPLDYVPLVQNDVQQTVLAAAIAPEVVSQITEICTAAGFKPQRMVLRPGAAASLLKRQSPSSHPRVSLLLDVLADEADLSVLVEDRLVFTRTARLPVTEEPSERIATLISEVRRTIVAAQNQQPGGKVEAIYVCGSQTEDAPLVAALGQRLNLPCEVFNPFDLVTCDHELKHQIPVRPGRFAPLIGMLLDEAEETQPAIDFLQPRKSDAKRPPARPLMLAGTLVATVVLAVVGWLWFGLSSLDEEIDELTRKLSNLDKQMKTAALTQKEVGQIDEWAAADVLWLGELDYLSQQFPPAADAQLLRLRLLPDKAGGRMELDGVVRTTETLDAAEQNLRDGRHTVVGQGSHEDEGASRYRWRFGATVSVSPHIEPAPKQSVASPAKPAVDTKQKPATSKPSGSKP